MDVGSNGAARPGRSQPPSTDDGKAWAAGPSQRTRNSPHIVTQCPGTEQRKGYTPGCAGAVKTSVVESRALTIAVRARTGRRGGRKSRPAADASDTYAFS